MQQNNVRNFSIIAHIDHGKSTIADRILEITGSMNKREMKDQLLDDMELERERGITIKLNAVCLNYTLQNQTYKLHLIDTPGHVDFSYEVSRSLAACEGAILVVDAAQGIQAQTLANLYLALENNLVIIPVINKIDLPNADVDKVKQNLCNLLGCNSDDIILCSAKNNIGIDKLLEAIIKRIPAPKSLDDKPLQALIFDTYFDAYRGVIARIRIMQGTLKKNDKIYMMATKYQCLVNEVGINNPKEKQVEQLHSGDVGWIAASIKDISKVHVGDTITLDSNKAQKPLDGYKEIKPMVFAGIFPIESNKYELLKDALDKLKLNDASLSIQPESSTALGFGFRCGFLGLLHMDIITSRIKREFNIDVIATLPSVIYEVVLTNKKTIMIDSSNKLPEQVKIDCIKEPFIKSSIFVPSDYIGAVMKLCQSSRGIYDTINYIDSSQVIIHYKMPLSEIVYDFFDKLKSTTKGYASFDYEYIGNMKSDLVKMDILINQEPVDALSVIVHKDFAYDRGKLIVQNLKNIIPRQLFVVPLQACIGSKVIARETIPAMRKNVLAKCYGGDISRKRKLLEKQKEGKKKMKMIGKVEIPSNAFLSILSSNVNQESSEKK